MTVEPMTAATIVSAVKSGGKPPTDNGKPVESAMNATRSSRPA